MDEESELGEDHFDAVLAAGPEIVLLGTGPTNVFPPRELTFAFARKGIGLPVTCFAHSPDDIEDMMKMVGGAPSVIKLLEGTQGIGVVLAAAAIILISFGFNNLNRWGLGFAGPNAPFDLAGLSLRTHILMYNTNTPF